MFQSNDMETTTPPPLRPKPLSFTNGILKRHSSNTATKPPLYKECLRNHAASLGGHAVDGCCEFMPSPLYSPSDPSSLKCAACGCHRNFHRRGTDADPEEDDEEEEDDDDPRCRNRDPTSPSPPLTLSAPHMLLALSAGGHPAPTHDETNGGGISHPAPVMRKRFRTKFSKEQKEKMQELSDRLGWKMRKQDEVVVEDFCRDIGVGKDVFKVWMHNNKNAFLKRSGDNPIPNPNPNHNSNHNHGDNVIRDGVVGMQTMAISDNNNNINNNCNGNGNGNGNGSSDHAHLMNGSSSSS